MISSAALFAGVGYYRQGKSKEKIDQQTTELNTINLLKQDVESLQKQVKDLTEKVETLTKDNEAKAKKLEEWMLVFQGRDPQVQDLIKAVNEYIALGKPAIAGITNEILPTARRLEKFLDKQTF